MRVPGVLRSPGRTVNVPAPLERQITGSAPGNIESDSTSTRPATMKAA
jgi:hypothetical protein